jgi:glycine/serine hydroxymethyltransferase
MDEAAMTRIAEWIVQALRAPKDEALLLRLSGEVKDFARAYPIPALSS